VLLGLCDEKRLFRKKHCSIYIQLFSHIFFQINDTALNYTAMGIRFAKSAGITFPTLAMKSVDECKTYVESMGIFIAIFFILTRILLADFNGTFPISSPPTGIRSCNPKATLAWICIRQKFVLVSYGCTIGISPKKI